MTKCEHWDCGWCCAPTDVKTNALGSGVCNLPEYCPYLKSQNKMNEIQQTKEDIAVLQEKLKKLEELEIQKSKTPVEEAYKEVYGCYPPTTPTISNFMENRWSAFQKGYNASNGDCKVEEEPKPTPETLFDIVRHTLGYSIDCCDEIVDAVEEWLPKEQSAKGSQNVYVECTVEGFNDAINKIKNKLR